MSNIINKYIMLMPNIVTDDYNRENKVWKKNPSILGGQGSAVKRLLSQGDMLRIVMPVILGATPDSRDVNFTGLCDDYLHSISVDVPVEGIKLNIGFEFICTDEIRKVYIQGLNGGKPVATDDDLLELVLSKKVQADEMWKYGTPLSVEHYIQYLYASVSGLVANSKEILYSKPELLGKCTHFLHDLDSIKEEKKLRQGERLKAIGTYAEIIKDLNKVESILLVANGEIDEVDEVENLDALERLYKDSPRKLIDISSDKNLIMKATVRRYINANILRELMGTTIVVDANDASVIIGNNMEDTLSWFSNELNKAKVSEYATKYKTIKSQKAITEKG